MTQESASWIIGNKKVKAIQINNKEVQSIKANNVVIWQKEPEVNYDNYIELKFTGQVLSQYTSNTLIGSNIIIDYGDGNIVTYEGNYSHTYATNGNYIIKIYGVTSLGTNCFRNCANLTSIEIPNNVISFGDYCFGNCTSLTSISIPNSITSLGVACFGGCTSLTSISIPNNITSLGASCFRDCTNLTSIEIPNSVTSLKNYCFYNCTNLAYIHLNWTSSDIITYNSDWIANAYSRLKFNIPNNTQSAYVSKGYPSDKLVETTINEKTDTEFIGHNGIFLVDTDGNGLGGKEIKYQGNYSNQLVTYTHITQENGYTYIDYLLGDPDLKCILFEGDEEYNSCLYENSNYKPPNDPTNPIK